MSNVEKIIKQAIATFSKPQLASKYQESLNVLVQNVVKLTGEDVGIDTELVNSHNRGPDLANPIGYVSVYEDANIVVSVFVLKSNSVIPLHDHPVMHGILKVLQGTLAVQSYSSVADSVKPRAGNFVYSMNEYYHVPNGLYPDPTIVRRNSPAVLSAKDDCAIITPFENNIHEVTSTNGPSAFLDILAPPYGTYLPHIGPRRCSYFNVDNYSQTEYSLSPAAYHPNYRTVELPYRGPKITI